MPNRMISLERNTNETQIDLTLDLDGTGRYEVDTGCGFLNHMLELFARHGRFDLVLTCHGEVQVDYHHTTEDVGIALGQAFARALGDMRGIQRYGSFYLPMDEALILCAVDLSGRCRHDRQSGYCGCCCLRISYRFFPHFRRTEHSLRFCGIFYKDNTTLQTIFKYSV